LPKNQVADLPISPRRRLAAWLVHLYTASGAVFGLLTLKAISWGEFIAAFWYMCAAIVIDSSDGLLARLAGTKVAAPQVDGALLDNIVDYSNYAMIPAFFMIESDLLPVGLRLPTAALMVMASAYQFSQSDAKTEDHFFKGFPSYWNIVVFYLFLWQLPPRVNFLVILLLAAMTLVPIKYPYPSRMSHLGSRRWLRRAMLAGSLIWAFSTILLLWLYPQPSRFFMSLSLVYVMLYFALGLIKTFDRHDRILGSAVTRRDDTRPR